MEDLKSLEIVMNDGDVPPIDTLFDFPPEPAMIVDQPPMSPSRV